MFISKKNNPDKVKELNWLPAYGGLFSVQE
jgi:hypothetical protein